VRARRNCRCQGNDIVCDGDNDVDGNTTDTGVDVAEARADEVDLVKNCTCDVNGTIVCEDDDHSHNHTDAEESCHCHGTEVHCEDESLVALCHCHEDEEIHRTSG
jgi:hypothetical protein